MSVEQMVDDLPQIEPLDEHNRVLVGNTHPTDWTNPQPADRYNMVVIGAGTAGLVTAAGAAGLGARVALIERALMGGDCLNVGCVPSKALIRCSRAVADARHAGAFGVEVEGDIQVDFGAVMKRMRRIRAAISSHDSAARFRDLGVDVFIGPGRFAGPETIEVDGATLRFSRACIATGARAAVPPIDGLQESGFLTNETVFSLTELPGRLAVLGAGPIGCELAQAFSRFGSQVTVVEMGDQILGREDRDAAVRVHRALERDGVQFRLGARVVGVRRTGDGRTLRLELKDGTSEEIEVDQLLLSAGRAPNVEGLGLDEAGIEFDTKKGVQVDERLRTTNRRVYAAGDVCFDYKFTHTADAMARIVIQNALFFGRSRTSDLTIPWCTYTDPEIAHVGMYPRQAEEQGIEIDTYTIEFDSVDRARLDGERDGLLKVHTKKGKDKIVGATLVARHAGEMISELTLAMVAGAGLGTIARTIHPYPTQAEAIKKAGDQYNRTRLSPRVKSIFDTIMRWRR
ncbi:MAG: mercuric reductase [Phycisphaerales bacterium]